MAKCEDCIHDDVCGETDAFRLSINCNKNAEKCCKHFGDRNNYEEVRYGEWKEIVKDIGKGRTLTHYKCSLCGVYISEKSNWCYHCGAKMDLERRSDL